MTLLSTLGFQPRKSKELIAPIHIGFADISIILPVKNNQRGITLFLSEFIKTHPPTRYPREIIIVDNDSQLPISIPGEFENHGLNITLLRSSAQGPACARNLGSRTRLVMRIVHWRRPLALASPSRALALTRATLSLSQADLVLFLITKPVREPKSWHTTLSDRVGAVYG